MSLGTMLISSAGEEASVPEEVQPPLDQTLRPPVAPWGGGGGGLGGVIENQENEQCGWWGGGGADLLLNYICIALVDDADVDKGAD